jgi:hypothetical protein
VLVGRTPACVKYANDEPWTTYVALMLSRIVIYVCILSRNKVEYNPVTIELTSFDEF